MQAYTGVSVLFNQALGRHPSCCIQDQLQKSDSLRAVQFTKMSLHTSRPATMIMCLFLTAWPFALSAQNVGGDLTLVTDGVSLARIGGGTIGDIRIEGIQR